MPAYEIPNLRFSGEAEAAIDRYRFVTVTATEGVVHATAGGTAIGVSSQPCEKAGEVAEIYDGIVFVEAGAAVAAGESVEVGAEGKAVKANTGDVVGIAVTGAGAAGELLSVKL